MMTFEERILAITASVTDIPAQFEKGVMYLQTQNSSVAAAVYNALCVNNQTVGIIFGKIDAESTFYEFV